MHTLLTFLKIGAIGFGGGSALIPVVEKEVIREGSNITPDDYVKHTVIANITPGALPVKLGATCGYQIGGAWGAVAGAYGVALPGVILTVLILSLFSVVGSGVIGYFNDAAVGISLFIIFLLVSYIAKTLKIGSFKTNWALCLTAFAITGGKEVRLLLRLLFPALPESFAVPILDISTINLMIVAFFCILLADKMKNPLYAACVGVISAAYVCSVGKFAAQTAWAGSRTWLVVLMVILVVAAQIQSHHSGGTTKPLHISTSVFVTMGMLLVIPLVLTISVAVFLPTPVDFWRYISNVILSTLTSFGGGEAYVSVADGFFVQSGMIGSQPFYNQLIPIANALPGPILVKVTAGMGFLYGNGFGGILAGFLLAAAAGSLSVGFCTALAVLVSALYDQVKNSAFIINLKKYILPVICGMLIATSCSMLYESIKITGEKGIPNLLAAVVMAGVVVLLHVLHKKCKLPDIVMLLATAALSFFTLFLY